jgi:NAD(P)-dependent dehydrogenase (short-subunit alcohol dehydrogenase family)
MTEAGRLKGRRAVVTGGGRGIGASTAASENFATINARIELFDATAQRYSQDPFATTQRA